MLKDHDIVAVLPAEDFDRARRFYEETLGFEPEDPDPGGVYYRSGSTRFSVYPTQYAGKAQHTQAGWVVEDVRKTVGELRARGVRFEEYDFPGLKTDDGIADLGVELSAWFKDSEGNTLAVIQLTPGGKE
jgi:catechol 2,3-dioxygenase-like lactoylglutathione lyase family enzyme